MNSLCYIHNHINPTSFTVASPYLLAFDFNLADVNGLSLLNKATGTYDCTLLNTACIQSTVVKYGTGALLTDGNATALATINIPLYPSTSVGFTFASFFNLTVAQSNSNYLFSMGTGTRLAIRVGYNVTYGGNCIYFQMGGGGQATTGNGGIIQNSTIVAIIPTFWQLNTWYHICWTITPVTGSILTHKMYIDGTLITTVTNAYMSFNQTYPAGSCAIGCNTGQSNNVFYMDNLRLWNKTATQTEITAMVNGTL